MNINILIVNLTAYILIVNSSVKFPESNSGRAWAAQIKVGSKLLGSDGKFYSKPSKFCTHFDLWIIMNSSFRTDILDMSNYMFDYYKNDYDIWGGSWTDLYQDK